MTSKINVCNIIFAHYDTLRDSRSGRIHVPDLLVFIAIPILASLVILLTGSVLKQSGYGIFLTSFSIFTGFLINFIVALVAIKQSSRRRRDDQGDAIIAGNQHIEHFIGESIANFSYMLLLTVISVVICAIGYFITPNIILTSILVFISTHFVITMLMCIKRIYAALTSTMQ